MSIIEHFHTVMTSIGSRMRAEQFKVWLFVDIMYVHRDVSKRYDCICKRCLYV